MASDCFLKELRVAIGGITLSVNAISGITLRSSDPYKRFLTLDDPDVFLHSHKVDSIPYVKKGEKIFRAGEIWDICHSGEDYLFSFYSEDFGATPYKAAVISKDFKSGNIYVDSRAVKMYSSNPLTYPFGEVFMINMLSLCSGALIHSCGVKINDEGLLFIGASGAGKSTIAKIWKKELGAVILNDDRVIVRKVGSRFYMYGTPWHGEARVYSQGEVPLKKIFFIRHADNNSAKKLDQIDTASRLIACSFPPFWDKAGMEFILNFSSELAQNIPAYELGFLPDKNVLSFLKNEP